MSPTSKNEAVKDFVKFSMTNPRMKKLTKLVLEHPENKEIQKHFFKATQKFAEAKGHDVVSESISKYFSAENQ